MSEPTLNFVVQTHTAQFAVPGELLKKNLKHIQRLVEKARKSCTDESARAHESAATAATTAADAAADTAGRLAAVRKLVRAFEALQQKLAAARAADADFRSRLQARLQRLNQLQQYTVAVPDADPAARALDLHSGALMAWLRDETNLLVVDYLTKCNTRRERNLGLRLSARLHDAPLARCLDLDVHAAYNRVFLSITEDHDLGPISAWLADNRSALRKVHSNLQFEIHFCRYLATIDADPLAAVEYSKTHLAPYARRENYAAAELHNYRKNVATLTHIGAPLVYVALAAAAPAPPRPRSHLARLLAADVSCPPKYHRHNSLLSEQHWLALSRCFTDDYTRIYGLPQTCPLFVYLAAGLASLKTKSCYCNRQNTVFGPEKAADPSARWDSSSLRDLALRGPNQYYKLLAKINQCPVCSPELYDLGSNLPYAQLITRIFNNPFKLPNGNIYPFDKLLNPEGRFEKDILVRNSKIRDPLTHEIFFIDDCVRVFPA